MIEVSIIIPIYNDTRNIIKTLNAFLNQTIKNNLFEIILVDNHSDDHPERALKDYFDRGRIIFLKNTENKGPAFSRNRGLEIAKGRIVVFSNSDTVPCKSYLEEHIKSHNLYPEKEYVVLGSVQYPPDINITPLMRLGNFAEVWELSNHKKTYDWYDFGTGNVSLKRSFLSIKFNSNIFTNAGFEDTDFAYRLSKNGMKIIANKKAISYHYHFHTSHEYINKVIQYGSLFASWMAICDVETQREIKKRYNYFIDRKNLLSLKNLKVYLIRVSINGVTAPLIKYLAKKSETIHEGISLFLYIKLHKYIYWLSYRAERERARG